MQRAPSTRYHAISGRLYACVVLLFLLFVASAAAAPCCVDLPWPSAVWSPLVTPRLLDNATQTQWRQLGVYVSAASVNTLTSQPYPLGALSLSDGNVSAVLGAPYLLPPSGTETEPLIALFSAWSSALLQGISTVEFDFYDDAPYGGVTLEYMRLRRSIASDVRTSLRINSYTAGARLVAQRVSLWTSSLTDTLYEYSALVPNVTSIQVQFFGGSGYGGVHSLRVCPMRPLSLSVCSQYCAADADQCVTATPSNSASASLSGSPSWSASLSVSLSASVPPSATPTETAEPTRGISPTGTPTASPTASSTGTGTQSRSTSGTGTVSPSSSASATPTTSTSTSGTPTSSVSLSASVSPSASQSPSISATASSGSSPSPTSAPTRSATVTSTGSVTASVSLSNTLSASASVSPSQTPSVSAAPSPSPSRGASPSLTPMPQSLVCDTGLPGVCGVGRYARRADGSIFCEVVNVPTPEKCDNVDSDCSGVVDDNLPTLHCGVGECRRSVYSCELGVEITECTPGEPQPEVCSGKDLDCDGIVDSQNACADQVFISRNAVAIPMPYCVDASTCTAHWHIVVAAYALNGTKWDLSIVDNDATSVIDGAGFDFSTSKLDVVRYNMSDCESGATLRVRTRPPTIGPAARSLPQPLPWQQASCNEVDAQPCSGAVPSIEVRFTGDPGVEPIVPLVDSCVYQRDELCVTTFGYYNPNAGVVVVQTEDNKVNASASSGLDPVLARAAYQPQTFLPGRVYGAMTVQSQCHRDDWFTEWRLGSAVARVTFAQLCVE